MVSYHGNQTTTTTDTAAKAEPILCIQMRKTSNYGSVIAKFKHLSSTLDEEYNNVNCCRDDELSVATTNSSGSRNAPNTSFSDHTEAMYDQLIALTKQDTYTYVQRDYISRRNNRSRNKLYQREKHNSNRQEEGDEYDEATESTDCNDYNILHDENDDALTLIHEYDPSVSNNYKSNIDVEPSFVMEVDESCREKMCEWSYRICDHFHTSREIVAIAFNFLDRFNDSTRCDRTAFKLASMTCLYIATKVFHNKQLSVSTLVELSRNEFNAQHIIQMERVILSSLDYKMNPPTVQVFLHHYQFLVPLHQIVSLVARSDISVENNGNLCHEKISTKMMNKIFDRANYYSELVVYDYSLITEPRQHIAIACMFNAIDDIISDSTDRTGNSEYDYYCYDIHNDVQMQYEEFQNDFLAMIQTNVISYATTEDSSCIDIDRIYEIQERVWYLYSCSADYQQNQHQYNHHHNRNGHFFYHQYQTPPTPVEHHHTISEQNSNRHASNSSSHVVNNSKKVSGDNVSGSSPISVLPTRGRVTGLRNDTFSVRIF